MSAAPGVERVDFVSVPVRDLERADRFYGETLGLERSTASGKRSVEYEADLAVFRDPDGNALQLHRRYAPFEDGRMP